MFALQSLLDDGAVRIRRVAKWGPHHLKRLLMLGGTTLVGEARFRTNQIRHMISTRTITDKPYTQSIDRLNYFAGRSEHAGLRGGEIPWEYMQGLCDDHISRKDKHRHLMRTLAQLPSNVSFVFKADPQLRDASIVRDAFHKAGFKNEPRATLIFKGEPGKDPIDRLKSDSRTKVRSARRDLEFTDMDTDSFFDYYQQHLGGKKSHFYLNIDRALMKDAITAENPKAEIIAVRRKAGKDTEAGPVDAAMICSTGSDGYCRVMRISFRHAAEGDIIPPHKQALKMLIVEAMKRASDKGLPLDVDGFTAGGNTLYSRFGCFEEVSHDRYIRRTPQRALHYLTERFL